MPVPKNYFSDRAVVLLLGGISILTLIGTLMVLLRLDSSRSAGYIVEYRSNLGLSGFKTGSGSGILSFIIFWALSLAFSVVVSMKLYSHRRHYAIAILFMGLLLSLMAIVVSNALLVLR